MVRLQFPEYPKCIRFRTPFGGVSLRVNVSTHFCGVEVAAELVRRGPKGGFEAKVSLWTGAIAVGVLLSVCLWHTVCGEITRVVPESQSKSSKPLPFDFMRARYFLAPRSAAKAAGARPRSGQAIRALCL